MVRCLPKRCLHWFGYVQGILIPIPIVPYEGIDRWFIAIIL